MDRRKIIRRIAQIAGIVFIISLIGLLMQFPYRSWHYNKHLYQLNEHLDALTSTYQDYLSSTAQKIRSLPVAPEIISEIQSKFLQERQNIKFYLWMSDIKGEFIFGVPSAVFSQMNVAFDKYRETIEKDGSYIDRNDFLAKLVDKHAEIDFSEFERGDGQPDKPHPFKRYSRENSYHWRFYDENRRLAGYWYLPYHQSYVKPRCFTLSSPVLDEHGAMIADIYLKVDDSLNSEMYFDKNHLDMHDAFSILIPIFGILLSFAGSTLWFLLPTWVYIDAQQRGLANPLKWALLTVVSLFFGLIIYLITRPQTMQAFHCPQCAKELNGVKSFCPYCGFDLSSTMCPQCQYPIKPDWSFCPSCRVDLKRELPAESSLEDESSG